MGSSRVTLGSRNVEMNKLLIPPVVLQVREKFTNRQARRRPSSSSSPSSSAGNWVGKAATAGAAGSILFGKGKYIFTGLKLFKATPLLSMLLTSATYSLFFGWPYAVGMVGQILIHETGHLVVLRHYGVPFSPMVMIPFLGAGIQMDSTRVNPWQEAMIAFGGPLAGGAAAGAISMTASAMDSQLLYALADFGYIVNLFNMLPILPLDGGRIAHAVSPWITLAGLAGGWGMALSGMIGNPLFYLILLSGTFETGGRATGWRTKREETYHRLGMNKQVLLVAAYAALAGALLLGQRANDRRRKTPKQLQREKDTGWIEEPAPWGPDGKYDDAFEEPYRGPRSGSF